LTYFLIPLYQALGQEATVVKFVVLDLTSPGIELGPSTVTVN